MRWFLSDLCRCDDALLRSIENVKIFKIDAFGNPRIFTC